MMQNQEAFLYIWHDKKLSMDYLGYHKGNPVDGYICSHLKPADGSFWMLEEYKERPEDFTRIILAYGTAKECRKWEEVILTYFDAARSPEWYNKHNGGEDFVCTKHSEETKSKMKFQRVAFNPWQYMKDVDSAKKNLSRTRKEKKIAAGKNNPMYNHQYTEETIEKMRKSHLGKTPWNKGKKMTKEYCQNVSAHHGMKGKHHTTSSIEKMRASRKGKTVWNKGIKWKKGQKNV